MVVNDAIRQANAVRVPFLRLRFRLVCASGLCTRSSQARIAPKMVRRSSRQRAMFHDVGRTRRSTHPTVSPFFFVFSSFRDFVINGLSFACASGLCLRFRLVFALQACGRASGLCARSSPARIAPNMVRRSSRQLGFRRAWGVSPMMSSQSWPVRSPNVACRAMTGFGVTT